MPAPAAPHASPAVQAVSQWALINAFSFAVVVALAFTLHDHVPYSPSSLFLSCSVELTAAEAAKERALARLMLWCAALQGAAATLALLQPGRGRRSSLLVACVALALAADPGYIFLWMVSTVAVLFFAVGDLLGFLALLLGENE